MEETNQAVNLVDSLKSVEPSKLLTAAEEFAMAYGPKLIGALLILVFGIWFAKIARSILGRILNGRGVAPIVASFIINIAYIGLVAFVVIATLQTVGIPTTSFVAVLGAAGLAIGLALQGSLSNFAAGFMLIIFQPFKKGDYVEAGGTAGVVQEIQVFTTVLNTPDNKRVIVPNSAVMGGTITNFSMLETRRVDWLFGVSYSDDIDKVKATIRRVVEADPRVLKDPEVVVVLKEMADSSVNFAARAWVKSPEYWNVFFDINERIKKTFDAEGTAT